MRDKMAVSAYILKIVEKDPFLRLQMRAKEDFIRHQLFSTNKQYIKIFNHKRDDVWLPNFGFFFHFSASLTSNSKEFHDKSIHLYNLKLFGDYFVSES